MNREDFSQKVIDMIPVLHRVAYMQLQQAADREDAVQEAIRRAWEKREHLREERYMQTWVIRILLNVCDTMRRRNARVQIQESFCDHSAPERNESVLIDALMSLDEKHRLPLQLRYIEEYSVAEVARMLRIPQGTVKSRLARGREKLRALLDEEVFE